jgi:predicted AlkP superfamily phosphohydrolase/phosphomutase
MEVLDHCLGQLMELADRRRAALVVLGDHGFGPFREKICVNELLRQQGLLQPASHADAFRHRVARTAWKVRKWLHRRSQRGGTAALRRPLAALAPLDWRRTRAFAVHGELSALVYLNDAERFGRGPIASPRQREQTEAETIAAFREARHPVTREPLFESAYAARDRLGCDPITRGWPDVVAIPAPGFHTRTKFGSRFSAGKGQLLFADSTLTGTHRRETALMIRSPFAAGRQIAEMRDVAPTILRLLGQPPAAHMSGCALDDSAGRRVDPELLAGQHGVQFAAKGTALGGARDAGTEEPSSEDRQIVENRLRDLGYLE